MEKNKKRKINKKMIIIVAIVLVVIAIIIATIILLNKKKEEQNPEVNNEIEVGQFVSEIDMTDTTNSEGNTIDRVETFFPDIPNGETGYITATTPKDIATAYEITIERDMR